MALIADEEKRQILFSLTTSFSIFIVIIYQSLVYGVWVGLINELF